MGAEMSLDETSRKPRIMVAGEFSAGKTRLINSLMGQDVLPSQVTSTSLPPIWLIYGDAPGVTVGTDGTVVPLDFENLDVESTAYCVLPLREPLLEHFDIIDTPGNSDPNIPASCWERMLSYADGLVWCTSAMQAWRQSEKSACSDFPEELLAAATILVTQADRLPDERSRNKVLKRVNREAAHLFPDMRMASLIDADDVAAFADYLKARAAIMPLRGAEAPDVDAHRIYVDAGALDAEDLNAEALSETATEAALAPFADGGEVVQLAEHQKMQPDGDEPLSEPDRSNEGPARRLWAKITEGADLNDIGQLKTCVNAMLDHLDTLSKGRSSTEPAEEEQQAQTQGA